MIIGITGSFGSGKTTVANMFKQYGFEVINVDKLYHGIYNKDKSLKNKIKKEFGTTNRNKLKKIVFNDYKKLRKLNKITHPIIINSIKKEISTIIKKTNNKQLKDNNSIIIKNNNVNSNKEIINNYNNKNKIIEIKNIDNYKNKKTNGAKLVNNKKSKNYNGFKINGKNSIGNKKIIIDAPLLMEAKAKKLVDKIIAVKCSKKEQINRILKKKKYSKKEIDNIIKSQMPINKKIKSADFVVDNSKTIKETEKQVKNIIEKIN